MNYLKFCQPDSEAALLAALTQLSGCAPLGLTVKNGQPCGILIARGNQARAQWHAGHGLYHFVPAGEDRPALVVHSLDEAVSLTQEMLLPGGRLHRGI